MYRIITSAIPKAVKAKVYDVLAQAIIIAPNKIKPWILNAVNYVVGQHGVLSIYEIMFKYSETKLDLCDAKEYGYLSLEYLESVKLFTVAKKRMEELMLPVVFGLSDGGSYSASFDEISVYMFRDAEFYPYSDFIRVGDKVFWDKASKPQLSMIAPSDKDLISHTNNRVLLKNGVAETHIKCGFALTGVHVNSWGHFIGNFLPKIAALESISESELQVLLPSNVDSHIQEVVEYCVRQHGSFKIIFVPPEKKIRCEKLFYCSSPSFIADHALFMHLSFVNISRFSKSKVYEYAKSLKKDRVVGHRKKLFIARNSSRNIKNYQEIETFFSGLGFYIVQPHLLSLDDKISLFSGATHIAGPGSSGFLNMIFCQSGARALVFNNFSRTLDLYDDLLRDQSLFAHDVTVLIGVDTLPGNIHSEFTIDIDTIKNCIDKIGFLDES